jgi:hypothetical protein
MQQVVTYDEAKLERLRTDLASRQAFLDELTAGMAGLQTVWEEKKATVEGLDAGSAEVASLQEEIGRLERRYVRINRHATLTFEAEEALRKQIRGLEGRVHFIPNGQIGSLTNRTYDWARALVEIPVGPEHDVDRVMALLLGVARDLKADPKWADEIVDEPQMLGVDKFTESGVIIKLMLKTHPERMFPVRRELLRRVKKAFDEAGIEPGVPHRVVRQISDGPR